MNLNNFLFLISIMKSYRECRKNSVLSLFAFYFKIKPISYTQKKKSNHNLLVLFSDKNELFFYNFDCSLKSVDNFWANITLPLTLSLPFAKSFKKKKINKNTNNNKNESEHIPKAH